LRKEKVRRSALPVGVKSHESESPERDIAMSREEMMAMSPETETWRRKKIRRTPLGLSGRISFFVLLMSCSTQLCSSIRANRVNAFPGDRNNLWWQDWWNQYIRTVTDPTVRPFLTSPSSISSAALINPNNVIVFDNTGDADVSIMVELNF
jgi:hypothetical protein